MAYPLPFLSHILYSAAPSVSALPVLFFCTQLVRALILTPLCPSVHCICQQHLTSTRQLIFVFKRCSDIKSHMLQVVNTALMNPLEKQNHSHCYNLINIFSRLKFKHLMKYCSYLHSSGWMPATTSLTDTHSHAHTHRANYKHKHSPRMLPVERNILCRSDR